ncbi:MAG: hypothetical protein KGL39_47575 [Patescibacteria group bacterium]|nr:hypothetical protein [Patescibacteria group bacterium]
MKTNLTLIATEADESAMEAVITIRELNQLVQRAARLAENSTREIQRLQVSMRNRLAIEGKRKAAPGDYPEAA